MKRQSGILLPVFSLPNEYGIGSFGEEAYKFIDFLKKSGVKMWQILPLVQTGYGNSPYSSVCSTSINPYFISLKKLKEEKLLTKEELDGAKIEPFYIDYGALYNIRYPLLRKAFSRFDRSDKNFKKFVKDGEFYDYAMFSALKTVTNYQHFYEWEDGIKYRNPDALSRFYNEHSEEVLFWQFVEFVAQKQWKELKKYANSNGVSIMGDMPLYVALDSVDVWVNPKLFKLGDNFTPKKVAGVPPDYFSRTGQLWGNPVYDYQTDREKIFGWWTNRLKTALSTFDYVRIDHFRGLDRYYEIDNGRPDATVGEWMDVPSEDLFNAIHNEVNRERIIAEDLGIIDDGVRNLLKFTGYPGMKILSFAFNGQKDNFYLPENVNENSVCYTGTHDNDTLKGLINNAFSWDLKNLLEGVNNSLKVLEIKRTVKDKEDLLPAIVELGFKCKSNLFIIPMQDIVGLNTEYRINEPGTVKNQNWAVRIDKKHFSTSVANKIKRYNDLYNR